MTDHEHSKMLFKQSTYTCVYGIALALSYLVADSASSGSSIIGIPLERSPLVVISLGSFIFGLVAVWRTLWVPPALFLAAFQMFQSECVESSGDCGIETAARLVMLFVTTFACVSGFGVKALVASFRGDIPTTEA